MVLKLDSLLKDSLNRAGITKRVDSAFVMDKFNEVVCELLRKEMPDLSVEEIEKEMQPMYIKNRILTVASLNPSLTQELKLREKEIVYRLNSSIGKDEVERIVFVV